MKILEELWYGNINPNERDVKPGSRLHKLGALIVRHEETLMPLLSEQAKEIYEKLRECQSELHGLNECEAFDINVIRSDCIAIGESMGYTLNTALTPQNATWWNPVTASENNQGVCFVQTAI